MNLALVQPTCHSISSKCGVAWLERGGVSAQRLAIPSRLRHELLSHPCKRYVPTGYTTKGLDYTTDELRNESYKKINTSTERLRHEKKKKSSPTDCNPVRSPNPAHGLGQKDTILPLYIIDMRNPQQQQYGCNPKSSTLSLIATRNPQRSHNFQPENPQRSYQLHPERHPRRVLRQRYSRI